MTPEQTVRGVAGPVGRLGGAWMFDAGTAARGTELGLGVWSWYHCGRGGVLGDCDPAVLVAAFGFFPPALQAKAWSKGLAVLPAAEAAREYAAACADWGRRTLPDDPALAALLEQAMAAAEVAGLPVFAGWRALLQSSPLTGAGRLALALQVAREHRGANHLVAVVAAGIPPLQAVVSGRYGTSNAEFFGWPQPWPDPEAAREAMLDVETVTDALVRPAYAALSESERDQLVTGLRALSLPPGSAGPGRTGRSVPGR